MPSPKFTFRLPQQDRDALAEMAKVYGANSAGGFLAEMVGAMCSADPVRIKTFYSRLIAGAGEQLTLRLNGVIDQAVGDTALEGPARAEKPAQKRRNPVKRPKRRPKANGRV